MSACMAEVADRAEQGRLERYDAAADSAEHYGAKAFTRLQGDFLEAALLDLDTLLHTPESATPLPVRDEIEDQLVCDAGLMREALCILTSAARGMVGADDLRQRGMALLRKMAAAYAEEHADTLGAQMEDDAREESRGQWA